MTTLARLAALPVVLIGFGTIGATVWRLLGESPDRVRLAGLLLREESGRDHPGHGAAAALGGMISSTVLTLAVIPALYALVKQWRLRKGLER